MGGTFSNITKKNGADEYSEKMRQYEDNLQLETDPTIENADDLGKAKLKWWQKLLYGKPARITYVVILGLVVGIITSLIIFEKLLDVEERTIYGSCLINENARFECLINSVEITDESSCVKAKCCWENKDILPFKCYHSFPTAYQYRVSSVKKSNTSGMEWTEIETIPNHDMIANITTHVHWETDGHLVIEVFDPTKFRDRKLRKKLYSQSTGSNTLVTNEQKQAPAQLPFQLGQLEKESYFHIEVIRNKTGETIFDTRLGPLMIGREHDHITISTVLPTEKFYGLKGGQKADYTLTYGVVNGFENSELPYYMSLEKSGAWHGVLIETSNPMLLQVIQAKGVMFHSETDYPEMNFHIFNGPTQAEVLHNLHTYIRKYHNVARLPPIPPYWALGLHLCRRAVNETMLLQDLESLAKQSFPYDSDCVDEYFRHPFEIDAKRFPNLTGILEILKSKKLFLSQKTTAPSTGSSTSNIWIMRPTTTNPFIGQVDNMTVKYFDFFNPTLTKFPEIPRNLTYNGISLDNFPKLYNSSTTCTPSTRTQTLFSYPKSSTTGLDTKYLWGSVCPDMRHNTGVGKYSRHKSLHNLYGQQSLKTVHQELTLEDPNVVISSTSIWTGSLYYGFFNGMEVPFSWRGLQESVAHTVRNYALAPIAGTPTCGSMVFNLTIRHDNELCLRWFQFALLLPFVRNSYDGVSSFGPLHFSDNYKRYLSESIEARYIYAPYYYTLLYSYQNNEPHIPMITPTSFYFDDANAREREYTFPLFDQFMIGKAILAAPMIEPGAMRSVYLPPGDWYAMDGKKVRNNATHGGSQRISGLVTETPLFLQGGCIIPTLLYETPTPLIEDSLKNNYSLVLGLAVASNKPDHYGNLTHPKSLHKLEFYAHNTKSNGSLTMTVSGPGPGVGCDLRFSTTIEQIRIFGLTTTACSTLNIDLTDHDSTEITCKYFPTNGRLHIEGLHMNWCKLNFYELNISTV